MIKFKLLIPTAGKGTRSKLNYPKTLYPVDGIPIILRIINNFSKYDNYPSVVVSPDGCNQIKDVLKQQKINFELILQEEPKGMGNAVLTFKKSKFYKNVDNIILVWGDIPFLNKNTIEDTIKRHEVNKNDFTFPTYFSQSAYTILERDDQGSVLNVLETRENPSITSISGEREIGFFIFKSDLVLDFLQKNLDNKITTSTKEHGFLYIIKHLVDKGYRVEGLPIAKEEDCISLNKIEDLDQNI